MIEKDPQADLTGSNAGTVSTKVNKRMDKVIEFIISVIDIFRFWHIIQPYESGVRVRLGKSNRKLLKGGFHWKLPFNVDEIATIWHVPSVKELGAQTVITKDEKSISLQAVVKYEIDDPVISLLDVGNEVEAVAELTQGIIRKVIIDTEFALVNNGTVEKEITAKARTEAVKWGIKIISVTIKSLGKIPTIRIMQ